MSSPKISVLLPVYNREKLVEQAITSILKQDFQDFELIVVDDGSTDQTINVVKSFKDKRIKIHCLEQNLGNANGRNVAIRMAQGEYLAIMDSDDVSMKDRLSKQKDYLDTHPEIDMLGSQAIKVTDSKVGKMQHPLEDGVIKARLLRLDGSCMIHPTCMMRASFLNKHHLEYPIIKTDSDHGLWINALSHGVKFASLPDYLLFYRRHPGNITSSNSPEFLAHEQRKTAWREKVLTIYFPHLSSQQAHEIAILMEKFREFNLGELRRGVEAMDMAMQDSVSHHGELKQEIFSLFNSIKKIILNKLLR